MSGMAEGIETTNPNTEKGGLYPILPKGKKTYSNQFISIETIENLVEEISKNFNKK